jgi:hypothetical protein
MFKKLAIKMLGRVFKRELNQILESGELKEKWIGKINAKVDLPKLTEAEEKEHLDAIWDALEGVIEDVVEKL